VAYLGNTTHQLLEHHHRQSIKSWKDFGVATMSMAQAGKPGQYYPRRLGFLWANSTPQYIPTSGSRSCVMFRAPCFIPNRTIWAYKRPYQCDLPPANLPACYIDSGTSPGLTLNLSSNNPFRNRAASPNSLSSQPSPLDPPRPVSRNPFLDTSSTNVNNAAQPSPDKMSFASDAKAPRPALTGNAADLFVRHFNLILELTLSLALSLLIPSTNTMASGNTKLEMKNQL